MNLILEIFLKKKMKHEKTILVIILIGLIIATFALFYFTDNQDIKNIENTKGNSTISLDTTNSSLSQKEAKTDKNGVLSNPRVSIRNGSGDEVIGLDHNGTIAATDIYLDENVNITGNATGRYGFFKYIGSLASKITKGWFTDVVSGDVNATGNITVEGIKLEANQTDHFIYNNASCIIIDGSTSILYVC